MIKQWGLIAVGLGVLSVGACGVSKPESDSEEPVPGWETISRDLVLGSRGSDVAALHEYLTNFGYFPNADLQRRYPAWRTIVPVAPAATDVFDEHTAQAVLNLQSNMGLPRTGVVDGTTRAVLSEGRCGVPDGIVAIDPSDKFSGYGSRWNKAFVLYSYPPNTGVTNLDRAAVNAAIDAAFQAWRNEISDVTSLGIFFAATAGAADIDIRFDIPASDFTADTTPPPASGSIGHTVIRLRNQANFWSIGAVHAHYDVQSVVTHEVGHALGLGHSSVAGATMGFPAQTGNTSSRTPKLDDHVAIMTRYGLFFATDSGGSTDLAGGPAGSIWAIGGGRVSKFGGVIRSPTWSTAPATPDPAVRIAVGPGETPWITTTTGHVFYLLGGVTAGKWFRPVASPPAKDIGVGQNGSVWIVSTANQVWYLAGPNWVQDHTLHSALKITVDAGGIPYILDTANQFYRYSSADPLTGVWQNIPGLSSDLAIGPGNYLWSIGGPVGTGQVSLGVRNDQVKTGDGSMGGHGSPAESQWWPPGGLRPGQWDVNTNVAVDSKGNPWFITSGGAIMTTLK